MTEKWIILLLVILGGAYSFILNVVKYRSANNPTPENVSDVFDAETYLTWKRYSAEHCRLSLISSVISCAVTLALLCTNVYAAFAALFPAGIYWQLFAVVLLEEAVGAIVGLVESYVGTMVIEQKYGFNRSTMKTFIMDRIRGLIISLILSLGLVMLIALFYVWLGGWMVVLFAGVVFCITLAISFLYPIFSRIGNKFVPLEDGELKDRLMSLLTSHGYHVKAIEVMDASRRTTKLNAYFTGFGKMTTIVLFDNLVNAMSPDEICAVFAHELGHGLHRDVMKMQIMNIGNMLLMAIAVWISVREGELHTAFGFTEVNYGFAYILTGVFVTLIQPLTGMLINAYSRRAEYRADKQAVNEGYGKAMIGALKKLARENFAELAPTRISVLLEYSHPPLADRIKAVEHMINSKE